MARRLPVLFCLLVLPALAQQRIPVASEGGIRDRWMLAPGTVLRVPDYPPALAARADSVCVSIGYLLGADGTPSDFVLLKGWNSAADEREPEPGYWSAFAEAAGAALGEWRFQPRPGITRPQPVFTAATFAFGARGTVAAVTARCRIPELTRHLRDLRAASHGPASAILSRLELHDDVLDGQRRQQSESMYRR